MRSECSRKKSLTVDLHKSEHRASGGLESNRFLDALPFALGPMLQVRDDV